ncbi:heavy metal-associated isoprenylated plant protein 37-like [Zingiber officinale]|uniref:heavy metal-associated isoprenylated plant protein 37-like n=1 Tax=Zingiber officinale TaxID=94328 RepID=UPI001C4CAC0F|nr:heavy metal-associated isoprenylated plant protein 37-like [Zingiber officinale]
MGKEEQFEVLKLKTHVLKVNIHCDGCKIKVKKLLHRIQGVFSVEVDVEKQKVTVQANVDSLTLIKKLTIAGKHAEAWPDDKPSNQAKNNSNNKQQKPGGGKKSKEQQGKQQQQQNKVQHKPLPSYSSDDEEDSDDEKEDNMRMLDKILKQGSNNHTAKKGGNGDANNNATMAAFQRMMNGNANVNGNVAGSGFGLQSQVPMPVNYHGQAHHLPAMARSHNMQQQQPQMMYLRSPQVAPYTGYYPSPYYYQSNQPYNDYVTHLFSDENTRGCVIM